MSWRQKFIGNFKHKMQKVETMHRKLFTIVLIVLFELNPIL